MNNEPALTESAAPSILAVDSNGTALAALVDLLRCEGYQTTAAATFETAKHLLEATHYDLLVADVRLRAFNGLHLVARSQVYSPATAAIIFTESPDSVLEREARRLGARYVVRPIESSALLRLVRETLAQSAPQ